jgi:hypothetical protein
LDRFAFHKTAFLAPSLTWTTLPRTPRRRLQNSSSCCSMSEPT